MNIRILVADDHQLFLTGLVAMLQSQPGLEVVGDANNGREALHKARQLRPDLVILDISMPSLNGIEATRQLTSELGLKTICLSMHTETRFVTAALQAGTSGYIIKDCELEELLRAIQAVAAGQTYLTPAVAGTLVDAVRNHQFPTSSHGKSELTDREREVLQLIAEGRSTLEIATELCISTKTVHTHRKHLQEKLGISSIAGLTKFALREGLTAS